MNYLDAKCKAILTVYKLKWDRQWRNEFDVIDVESEFTFRLLNPETEAESKTFAEAGKIDVLMRRRSTGRITVVEHKTTSDQIDAASDYWDRLRMDTQCSKYHLAALNRGEEFAGIIYDVLRKPLHRPLNIPLLDADGLKIVNDAQGQRVKTKSGNKWRETADTELGYVLQTRLETPEEFCERMTVALTEKQDEYFAQREVPRLDSDILEFMEDDWAISQQILYFRNRNLWPRNTDACNQFGRCEMFELCSGRATVDGIRYCQKKTVHAELKVQSVNGKELLTNSRVKTFNRCKRLHKLKYEDMIERVSTPEEQEALTIGTMVHKGLEDYFNSLKTK